MPENQDNAVPIVRPLKRSDPDLRKLARALIALAIAQNDANKPDSVSATEDDSVEQGETS